MPNAHEQLGDPGLLEHRDQVRALRPAEHGLGRRAGRGGVPEAEQRPPRGVRRPARRSPPARPRPARRRGSGCACRRATTASVRLPAAVSVGMSRRLLATRIAQARQPIADAGGQRGELERLASARTSCRPRRPARRRRRPSPRRARGSRRGACRRCRTTPRRCTTRPSATSHQAVVAASTRPATAATPNAANAARFTAAGDATPGADQPQRPDPLRRRSRGCRRSSRWRS